MKHILLLTSFLTASLLTQAQADTAIKQVIHTMFDGMMKADSAQVHATLDVNCSLKTILRKRDGNTVVLDETIQQFLKIVGQPLTDKIEERLLSYDIRTDGDMAMAWTPYQFYINDKLSHCGVNVFMLARRNNDWKIISITDTRRKDCK